MDEFAFSDRTTYDELLDEHYACTPEETRYLRNQARARLAEMSPEPVTEAEIRRYLIRMGWFA